MILEDLGYTKEFETYRKENALDSFLNPRPLVPRNYDMQLDRNLELNLSEPLPFGPDPINEGNAFYIEDELFGKPENDNFKLENANKQEIFDILEGNA